MGVATATTAVLTAMSGCHGVAVNPVCGCRLRCAGSSLLTQPLRCPFDEDLSREPFVGGYFVARQPVSTVAL